MPRLLCRPSAAQQSKSVKLSRSSPGIVQPGTLLFDRVKLLLEEALSWTNAEDKKQLALEIQPLMKKKDMYRGKAERLFKSQLKTLRGEG